MSRSCFNQITNDFTVNFWRCLGKTGQVSIQSRLATTLFGLPRSAKPGTGGIGGFRSEQLIQMSL
jgi:hypothetical protein